jgi:hypothetical protein
VLLALVILMLLRAGSGPAMADDGAPEPPCGQPPSPAYAEAGAPPMIEVWHGERHVAWAPPACTGWTARGDEILAALAGSFRHGGDVDDLLGRFGAVSRLTEIRYWSVTDQAWRSLVTAASALGAPEKARQREDFSVAEMAPGEELFFAQSDNRSSGTVVYRMRVLDFRPDRLVVETENVTAVGFWFVSLFEPGEVQATHFFERLAPGVWGYYGLTRTGTGPTLLGEGREASHINRAVALYRHLAGIPTDRDPPAAP